MPRLVVLSEGLTGRAYELKVDRTTIGRVDDNAFPIAEGSVSSHHCEVHLRGAEIVVKDLNSTNGTFINGQQVTGESVLKPGQILRLGQIEMRLESGEAAAVASGKKLPDQTMFVPQGVKLGADTATRPVHFGGTSPFEKKSNKGTKLFIILAIVIGAIIFAVIAYFVLVKSKNIGPTGRIQPFNQRTTSAAA